MGSRGRLVASSLLLSILLAGCDLVGAQAPQPTQAIGVKSAMLEFVLGFEADNFRSGEPVPATLTLTNAGQQSVLVNARMAPNNPLAPEETRDVAFTIRSPSGDELPLRVFINVRPPRDEDFSELAPGESVTRTIDLEGLYSLSTPGKYTVQAVYNNVSDPTTGSAWKGQLLSDVVTFTVTE